MFLLILHERYTRPGYSGGSPLLTQISNYLDALITYQKPSHVIIRSATLPPHQGQRNPMGFARRPQQEFLLLPSTAWSNRRRVLLRHRVRNRRNPPPRF